MNKIEYNKKYKKMFFRTKNQYIGLDICPKCYHEGYKRIQFSFNIKTNKIYVRYIAFSHRKYLGENKYSNDMCYIRIT